MRLLTICSSRRRPDRIMQMIDSYYATCTDDRSRLVVYVSHEDPTLPQYMEVAKHCELYIGRYRTMPEVLNYFCTQVFPYVQYYSEINDDHIFHTKGWDEAFIDTLETAGRGWGVVCGRDIANDKEYEKNWNAWHHPSGALFSGKMIRTLGYMIFPHFVHIACDDFVRDLAEGIGCLFCRPDIFIEHIHWVKEIGNEGEDPNYPEIYCSDSVSLGMKTYQRWREYYMKDSIELLRKAIREE